MTTLVLLPGGAARGAANANESSMAREIADDINRERAGRGLSSIPFDATYSAGAQRVAEDNRDRPCHACHSTDHPSGEVVWWGSDYPSSGSPIWWMGSPPHRALLLAPNATRIGVGVACSGTAHDAVAWIETQSSANAPPASPVATKAGTGSRCRGASSTPTSNAPVSAGPRPTTTRRPAESATTTRVTSAVATKQAQRSATTVKPTGSVPAQAATVGPVEANEAPSPFEVEAAVGSVVASATRPLAGRSGVGDLGTGLLLATFVGALLVGRATHRRR